MEIQFTKGGQPDGGKISNFLLEKVCAIISIFCKYILFNFVVLLHS